jgi:hypothetical protein
MTRPPWEVADIIRRAGDRFIERYHGSLTWAQLKVFERSSAAARPRWVSTVINALRSA